MRIRRFYYTGPAKSDVAHICLAKTHVEGNRVVCGHLTAKGWYWWRKKSRFFETCLKCSKQVGKGILVERVRGVI